MVLFISTGSVPTKILFFACFSIRLKGLIWEKRTQLDGNANLKRVGFLESSICEIRNIKAGDKVIHNVFGEGIVVNVNGKIATIAFSHKFGIKQIAINHKYLTKK